MAGAHQEQVDLARLPAHDRLRLAPVDLGLRAGVGDQRDERLDLADLPSPRRHVAVDLALGDLGTVLGHQPLVDPTGGMALLSRRPGIGLEPAVDDRPVGPEPRRRPVPRRSLRRRHRRLRRLADGTAVDAMPPRRLTYRHSPSRMVAPDLLELLHSRHSLPTSASRAPSERSASVAVRTEVGPVQASTVGPVETSTPSGVMPEAQATLRADADGLALEGSAKVESISVFEPGRDAGAPARARLLRLREPPRGHLPLGRPAAPRGRLPRPRRGAHDQGRHPPDRRARPLVGTAAGRLRRGRRPRSGRASTAASSASTGRARYPTAATRSAGRSSWKSTCC